MKRNRVTVICLSVLAALDAAASWPYDKIDKVDVDPMETLVANWRPAPFANKEGREPLNMSD